MRVRNTFNNLNHVIAYICQQTLNAEKRTKGQPAKQILLIHANVLNSYLLGDILEMYQKNGYKFISLTEALRNPAPVLNFPAKEDASSDTDLEGELLQSPP